MRRPPWRRTARRKQRNRNPAWIRTARHWRRRRPPGKKSGQQANGAGRSTLSGELKRLTRSSRQDRNACESGKRRLSVANKRLPRLPKSKPRSTHTRRLAAPNRVSPWVAKRQRRRTPTRSPHCCDASRNRKKRRAATTPLPLTPTPRRRSPNRFNRNRLSISTPICLRMTPQTTMRLNRPHRRRQLQIRKRLRWERARRTMIRALTIT